MRVGWGGVGGGVGWSEVELGCSFTVEIFLVPVLVLLLVFLSFFFSIFFFSFFFLLVFSSFFLPLPALPFFVFF